MCGIFAALSKQALLPESIEKCMHAIENRGYDSVGFCAIADNKHFTLRKGQKLPSLVCDHEIRVFIGHTRWATHGSVNINNAHPHANLANNLFLVHNGIIQNYESLRNADVIYASETDTEVLAKCLHTGTVDELRYNLNRCEGTWAIVVANSDKPNQLLLARKTNPLVIGICDDVVYVGSEMGNFPADKYIIIPDNTVYKLELHNDGNFTINNVDISSFQSVSSGTISCDIKKMYNLWTEQEIYEQSKYFENIDIDPYALEHLKHATHVYILACGSSLYAAEYAAKYWRYIQHRACLRVIDASEFSYRDDCIGQYPYVIVISQSGETHDCVRALEECGQTVPTLAIVNTPQSQLTRLSSYYVLINAGKEYGVAATKSFTAQVRTLIGLGSMVAQYPNVVCEITDVYIESCRIEALELINTIGFPDKLIILGSGYSYFIACEGALKIQELAYINVRAFLSGSLKHGPLALITSGVNVICLHGVPESTISEIKAREGNVFILREGDFPLHQVITLQWLAFELALKLGYNPDRPRNLAKTVTVA
jgi:glucosamine--fructose-6-phosphate aminotransferase (isomerizing)